MLAAYLAQNIVRVLVSRRDQSQVLAVLDPACGDGELLKAFFEAVPPAWRKRLSLTGLDKDESALEQAESTLRQLPIASLRLQFGDFLALAPIGDVPDGQSRLKLFADFEEAPIPILQTQFDAVISNPPYVRTQVLGSSVAQNLAARFELTGRVDLYHAFIKAMTLVLRDSGVLGLLTLNRFLTVQSSSSIRE